MPKHNAAESRGFAESPRLLPWLLVLFLGSGCSALIYEIVWLQLLQLVIGLTSVSLGVLLGTFMGGMCLGSLLLARFVSPRFHPLRVYAALELGIGVIGIAILFLIPWISQIYTESAGRGVPGILLRGIVAALCLLPPTMLMGATLPAISRWVDATPQGVSWLGFFYGGNIVGAVFGCLLAGFYLLRVHDIAVATYVAALINGAVALASFVLAARTIRRSSQASSRGSAQRDEIPMAPPDLPTPDSQSSPSCVASATISGMEKPEGPLPGSWTVYVAIAISGMSALGAEVVWTRLLSLILGGTVYTFSIILAVFLVGLGIGSGVGSFLSRSMSSPRTALGCCQTLLIGATAWSAYMIAQSLPYWPINPWLSPSPWFTFQLDLARCLWAILPPTILWGASFPLALATVASRGQDSGRLVGGVYAANTVGAIVGALMFSLWVIPRAGSQWAQRLLIIFSATAALITFAPLLKKSRTHTSALWSRQGEEALAFPSTMDPGLVFPSAQSRVPGRENFSTKLAVSLGVAACLGFAVLLVWSLPATPWGVVAYGRFMATYANRLAPEIVPERDVPADSGTPDIFCTYLGEGLNGSVAVTKWTSGDRFFHSAGKVQASSESQDMRLQRMLGHLSALTHQKPESVLVVACGAGVTAGTFVLHPDVKRIVICDIERLVPKFVAPMFEKENYGVVKDPRTQIVLDDGRHFVRTTKEKFDVITSDPIDPWVKGCAALNTVEYYEMCKEHLKPGGVMTLWIPLYESNADAVKSVIATFFKVFPNGILWSNDNHGEGYDAVLFGQVEPTRINLDQLQARLDRGDHARVKQSLAQVGFGSAISLLATYAGQASDMQEWLQNAEINRDRNLRLQYLAGMWLNSYQGSEILGDISQFCKFPDNLFLGTEERKQMLKILLGGPGTKSGASSQDEAVSSSASAGRKRDSTL